MSTTVEFILYSFSFLSHLSVLIEHIWWLLWQSHTVCTLHPQPPYFLFTLLLHQPRGAAAVPPGRPLTVCCTESTDLRPCHSCPSRYLPCSAFHSRTCLTPQPLSEMDKRRKHILFLSVTLSGVPQLAYQLLPRNRGERNLDCHFLWWKHTSADFKPGYAIYCLVKKPSKFCGFCELVQKCSLVWNVGNL